MHQFQKNLLRGVSGTHNVSGTLALMGRWGLVPQQVVADTYVHIYVNPIPIKEITTPNFAWSHQVLKATGAPVFNTKPSSDPQRPK